MNVIQKLESLRKCEHEATVELVRMLAECDRTKAYLEAGYGSIWDFLVRHLHYSNAAASRRYKAMKCVRKFPEVLDMLRKHETSLSALAAAEQTLDRAANAQELLGEMRGKSQRQVEQLVARQNPRPKRRETVRPVAVKNTSSPDLFPTSAAEVEDRVAICFSVDLATHEDMERAKAILSRKYPKGVTVEKLLQELLQGFLASHAPKPRKKRRQQPGSRHVPQATRDEVFARDGHRCSYQAPDGTRCGSRHDLELDHIHPWALGGTHEPENLRVLCAKHNRHRAAETFGPLPQGKSAGGQTRPPRLEFSHARAQALPLRNP